jgi:CPA2 family monovalent cation:H+ antiporter-2
VKVSFETEPYGTIRRIFSCGVGIASAAHVKAIETTIDPFRGLLLRTDILIISRARDVAHARHLYTIGVTDAVPETIETCLQLSEASLIRLGQDTGLVIASIHEKRDEFRHELQRGRTGGA